MAIAIFTTLFITIGIVCLTYQFTSTTEFEDFLINSLLIAGSICLTLAGVGLYNSIEKRVLEKEKNQLTTVVSEIE